jgi:hypothetical protein
MSVLPRGILNNMDNCPQTESFYLHILQSMKGERKLRIAFELYEMALHLARQNILEQEPGISEMMLKERLFRRFGYGPGRPPASCCQ